MASRMFWGTVFLLSALTAGCGTKADPVPVSVKGKVQDAQKKPIANMVLIFHPLDDTKRSKMPAFALDAQGQFQDRMLPGRYKATLAPLPTTTGGADAASLQGPAAPAGANPLARYADREQSPWEIVVPESGKDDLLLVVER